MGDEARMPQLPGEDSLTTVAADIHYYFASPGQIPAKTRFEKGSYVYLLYDRKSKSTRIEIANRPGTPEHGYFTGSLQSSSLESKHEFPTRCTITVSPENPTEDPQRRPSTQEWLHSTGAVHKDSASLRVHSLDLYFWTLEFAMEFYAASRMVLHPLQISLEPLDIQLRQEMQCAAVEELEEVMVGCPDEPQRLCASPSIYDVSQSRSHYAQSYRHGVDVHSPYQSRPDLLDAPTLAEPMIYEQTTPMHVETYDPHVQSPIIADQDPDLANYGHLFSGFSMTCAVPHESANAYFWPPPSGELQDNPGNDITTSLPIPVPNDNYPIFDMSPPPMIQDPGSPFSSSAAPSTPPRPQLRSQPSKRLVVSPKPPDTPAHLYRAPTYEQKRNASAPILSSRFSIDGFSQTRSYHSVPRPEPLPPLQQGVVSPYRGPSRNSSTIPSSPPENTNKLFSKARSFGLSGGDFNLRSYIQSQQTSSRTLPVNNDNDDTPGKSRRQKRNYSKDNGKKKTKSKRQSISETFDWFISRLEKASSS